MNYEIENLKAELATTKAQLEKLRAELATLDVRAAKSADGTPATATELYVCGRLFVSADFHEEELEGAQAGRRFSQRRLDSLAAQLEAAQKAFVAERTLGLKGEAWKARRTMLGAFILGLRTVQTPRDEWRTFEQALRHLEEIKVRAYDLCAGVEVQQSAKENRRPVEQPPLRYFADRLRDVLPPLNDEKTMAFPAYAIREKDGLHEADGGAARWAEVHKAVRELVADLIDTSIPIPPPLPTHPAPLVSLCTCKANETGHSGACPLWGTQNPNRHSAEATRSFLEGLEGMSRPVHAPFQNALIAGAYYKAQGWDEHVGAAAYLFRVPCGDVTPAQRGEVKRMLFALAGGVRPATQAPGLTVTDLDEVYESAMGPFAFDVSMARDLGYTDSQIRDAITAMELLARGASRKADHPFGEDEDRAPLTPEQLEGIAAQSAEARAAGDHEGADYGDSLLFLDMREQLAKRDAELREFRTGRAIPEHVREQIAGEREGMLERVRELEKTVTELTKDRDEARSEVAALRQQRDVARFTAMLRLHPPVDVRFLGPFGEVHCEFQIKTDETLVRAATTDVWVGPVHIDVARARERGLSDQDILKLVGELTKLLGGRVGTPSGAPMPQSMTDALLHAYGRGDLVCTCDKNCDDPCPVHAEAKRTRACSQTAPSSGEARGPGGNSLVEGVTLLGGTEPIPGPKAPVEGESE